MHLFHFLGGVQDIIELGAKEKGVRANTTNLYKTRC